MFYWVYEETYTMARPEIDDELWEDVKKAADQHPVYPSATVFVNAVVQERVAEMLEEDSA